MSRLPPWRVGGSTEWDPDCSGATPIVPGNGSNGRITPGRNSTRPAGGSTREMFSHGSGNSSESSPNCGMIAVHPQSCGSSARISTASASPGCASLTNTGPVTGLTWLRSMLGTSAAVESRVSSPPEASRHSSSIVAPDSTSSTGAIALSQTVEVCPAAWIAWKLWASGKPAMNARRYRAPRRRSRGPGRVGGGGGGGATGVSILTPRLSSQLRTGSGLTNRIAVSVAIGNSASGRVLVDRRPGEQQQRVVEQVDRGQRDRLGAGGPGVGVDEVLAAAQLLEDEPELVGGGKRLSVDLVVGRGVVVEPGAQVLIQLVARDDESRERCLLVFGERVVAGVAHDALVRLVHSPSSPLIPSNQRRRS